jgi:hypothetical protein
MEAIRRRVADQSALLRGAIAIRLFSCPESSSRRSAPADNTSASSVTRLSNFDQHKNSVGVALKRVEVELSDCGILMQKEKIGSAKYILLMLGQLANAVVVTVVME